MLRTCLTSEVFQPKERLLTAAEQKEEDKFMNEQTKPEAKPDDLTKTTETGSIDLTEQELDRVSGGDSSDMFLYLKGIK